MTSLFVELLGKPESIRRFITRLEALYSGQGASEASHRQTTHRSTDAVGDRRKTTRYACSDSISAQGKITFEKLPTR